MAVEFAGHPFGTVYPARPVPALPSLDARTIALRKFKEFLATLEFRRVGAKPSGQQMSVKFFVKPENILIEWPDHEKDLDYPSIVFLPGRATYESFGLGSANLLDETLNVFAPGTAVLQQAEYNELFTVEVHASKKAERRAMLAGLEAVLLAPEEESYALRLKLPDLFDTTATFSLEEREILDDPDSARNRRRGHIFVMMTVCVARLVNANTLQPFVAMDDC